MDRERLEYAFKIVNSEPGSSREALSSMVNLIIDNHERSVSTVIDLVQEVKLRNCLELWLGII